MLSSHSSFLFSFESSELEAKGEVEPELVVEVAPMGTQGEGTDGGVVGQLDTDSPDVLLLGGA